MQPTVIYASVLIQIVGEPKTWNIVLFNSVCFCHFVIYIVDVFVCGILCSPHTHAYTDAHIFILIYNKLKPSVSVNILKYRA